MQDKYVRLRELPLKAVAAAMEIDLSKCRDAKHGTEMRGPCPVCRPKKNTTGSMTLRD